MHDAACGAGLMCHQGLTEHLRSDFPRFGGRFAQMHTPLKSMSECSLASSSGMDLRFYDKVSRSKIRRHLLRFAWCEKQPSRAVLRTPNFWSNSFAWYSCRFIRERWGLAEH